MLFFGEEPIINEVEGVGTGIYFEEGRGGGGRSDV